MRFRISGFPLHPDGIQLCNPFLCQNSAAFFRIMAGIPLPLDPISKIISVLRHIISWDVQVTVGIKVALGFLISFVPLAVIAITPVHSDPAEPLDLFLRQFSFRIRLLLACDPLPQPFASRCHIGTRDIQVAVFLIVGGSQRISLFPLGIKNTPHHADLIKLCDTFFL